jgi:hypothetical protein
MLLVYNSAFRIAAKPKGPGSEHVLAFKKADDQSRVSVPLDDENVDSEAKVLMRTTEKLRAKRMQCPPAKQMIFRAIKLFMKSLFWFECGLKLPITAALEITSKGQYEHDFEKLTHFSARSRRPEADDSGRFG